MPLRSWRCGRSTTTRAGGDHKLLVVLIVRALRTKGAFAWLKAALAGGMLALTLASGLGANLIIPGPNTVFMPRPSPEFLAWLRLGAPNA